MKPFWLKLGQGILFYLDRLVAALSALTLLVSLTSIVLNVFYRYAILDGFRLLASHLQWQWLTTAFHLTQGVMAPIIVTTDEIPGYLLVWLSFLGAYLAVRHEKHIGFDLWVASFSPFWRKITRQGVDVVILLFFVGLAYFSLQMIQIDGTVDIETAEIAQGWFMAILPLASVLLVIGYAANILKRWNS